MPELINKKKANFGTMPVFITAISTILGAILFLRFGYAVGHTGLIGAFGIIILGHLVTISIRSCLKTPIIISLNLLHPSKFI